MSALNLDQQEITEGERSGFFFGVFRDNRLTELLLRESLLPGRHQSVHAMKSQLTTLKHSDNAIATCSARKVFRT